MKIGVPKEREIGELRVALVPDVVARLTKQGLEVLIESGAGEAAHFHDENYQNAGATIVYNTQQLWQESDLILKVAPPTTFEGESELDYLRPNTILMSFLDPLRTPERIYHLAQKQVTAFSMEFIPRTSRAQSMDALSSQANLAGHKATLLAAAALPRMFPMMTTAAGTIPPAKVLVLGAGVAGLQAIATARRLGAVVEAFDIRPTVKEEVQSVGAKFIDIPLEEDTTAAGGYAKQVSDTTQDRIRQVLTEHIKKADAVITTAQVPGKKAPLLITKDMVAQMKRGSIIVDIAAETGGNCAYTEAGRDVQHHGVTILGPINIPASVPIDASMMYSKNLQTLVQYLVKDGEIQLDFTDDIVDSACVTHGGEVRHPRLQELLSCSLATVS